MNCKRCNAPITQEDTFCKSCGNNLKEQVNVGMTNSDPTPVNPIHQEFGNATVNTPSVQQVAPQQPSYPNYNNTPNNYNYGNNNKNNNTMVIVMGVILLIALGIIVFLVFFNKGDNNNNDTANNNGGNDTSYVANNEWYETTFLDFKIEVYKDWQYAYSNEHKAFAVVNSREDFAMFVAPLDQTYQQTINGKSTIIGNMKYYYGLNYKKDYEKTISNKKIYIIEGTDDEGGYGALAFTQLDTTRIIVAIIGAETESSFNSSLDQFLRSVANVKSNSGLANNLKPSNNLEANFDGFKLDGGTE